MNCSSMERKTGHVIVRPSADLTVFADGIISKWADIPLSVVDPLAELLFLQGSQWGVHRIRGRREMLFVVGERDKGGLVVVPELCRYLYVMRT